MSEQMGELQAAIGDLVADVQSQVTATQALIDKIESAGVGEDLTDEIQAVRDASAALESSKAAADAVLTPAVVPDPTEGGEPAPEGDVDAA